MSLTALREGDQVLLHQAAGTIEKVRDDGITPDA
jgi:hypothetical protein